MFYEFIKLMHRDFSFFSVTFFDFLIDDAYHLRQCYLFDESRFDFLVYINK